jgi:hypothetical protein
VQFFHALDDDLVRAGALDLRSHRDQELGQIHHLGLTRSVLDDGLAVGQRGRHHEVFGAGDGDGLEVESRALEPIRACADVAPVDLDIRAHRLQSGHMDVDRTRADGAAARQRHVGFSEPREQGAQHQYRRPHRLDQLVRRDAFLRGGAIDLDLHLFVDGDRDAHAA